MRLKKHTCNRCGTTYDKTTKHYRHEKHKNGKWYWAGVCRSCTREQNKGYRLKNSRASAHFERVTGIPKEVHEEYMASTDSCGICGTKERRLVLDHCHTTGKVRGVLCHKCNSAIGMLEDDVGLVSKALQWLRQQGNRTCD